MEVCVTLPATSVHIGEQLSTQFVEENKTNRKMQIKILSCLLLLARQGLAIIGEMVMSVMQILSNCSSFWDTMMSL